MKLLENKKLFDTSNPNCTIVTSIEDIIKLFDKTPIFNKMNIEDNSPIGFVEKIKCYNETCIYGDIIVFDDNLNLGEMIEYVIDIEWVNIDDEDNYNIEIKNIYGICYENIKL